ncbi:MAG: phosphomannomutase [Selenomonadaceae bacterium]|nr:phosphomannomutase [Selenomonadaceae bacterium]MBR1730753.1 phosphomannomutase [Selenomonadaceae bacterium]
MSIDTSGFGAYDIRGIYPKTINQELAYRVGRVFPELFNAKKVAVGHDVRLSSPTINDALIRGLTESGCDVYDVGQCGTEMIYFTVGSKELDGGIMVTASHNPQQYNGLKCVKKGAQPISPKTGLFDIRDAVADESRDWSHQKATGNIFRIDIMQDYIKCILSYVDIKNLKPLKVVINTGNGAAGPIINELEKYLPFEIVKVFNDPDGYFPNGVPNPLRQDNRAVTSRAVIVNHADFGVAFDGDFDRCFLFDEKGGFIEGYYLVGFLAQNFLLKHKGAAIVYDPRAVWNTVDIVESMGGRPIVCRSGHSYVKEVMRRENAIYGGEMSSHHYFRDFYYCDSGMIPWLMIAELLCMSDKTLSQLMKDRQNKYPVSGELNTKVASMDISKQIMKKIAEIYGKDREVLTIDGIGVDFDDWRFNLRSSETEPYIRLNVETRGDAKLLKEKTEELLNLIQNA